LNLLSSMEISASGLTAQRIRMNVIAENLANVQTTRTPQGGPYLRKSVVLEATPAEDFQNLLTTDWTSPAEKVEVVEIVEDGRGLKEEYNPGHPDANQEGIVLLPNVNPINEMVNLVVTSRSFDANVAAFNASKSMALRALEIGK